MHIKIWLPLYKKFHRAIFLVKAHKALIKGVFIRLYCYYCKLLCHKKDNDMFTNDWAIFDTIKW